jgi:hypothetical protein
VAVLIAIITEILPSSRTVVDVDLDYAVSCVQTLFASLSVRTNLSHKHAADRYRILQRELVHTIAGPS